MTTFCITKTGPCRSMDCCLEKTPCDFCGERVERPCTTLVQSTCCPREEKAWPSSPLDVQVGGSHYKDMAIQPITYIMANLIPFAEGNIIKYISRWRKKGGVKDLEKARHMLDVLIEQARKEVVIQAGNYEDDLKKIKTWKAQNTTKASA